MQSTLQRSFTIGGYKYELHFVRCGKSSCTKCPHGPYWYLKIAMRDRKDVKKYLGKSLPEGVEEPR